MRAALKLLTVLGIAMAFSRPGRGGYNPNLGDGATPLPRGGTDHGEVDLFGLDSRTDPNLAETESGRAVETSEEPGDKLFEVDDQGGDSEGPGRVAISTGGGSVSDIQGSVAETASMGRPAGSEGSAAGGDVADVYMSPKERQYFFDRLKEENSKTDGDIVGVFRELRDKWGGPSDESFGRVVEDILDSRTFQDPDSRRNPDGASGRWRFMDFLRKHGDVLRAGVELFSLLHDNGAQDIGSPAFPGQSVEIPADQKALDREQQLEDGSITIETEDHQPRWSDNTPADYVDPKGANRNNPPPPTGGRRPEDDR